MTYLIGWAVITAIYIASVVLIKKQYDKRCEKRLEKYREIARENIKVFRISAETARGELKKEVERYEKLLTENISLKAENKRLKSENEELDEALEIAERDCDAYMEILAEHGLLSVAKEVVEVPDELPSGEGVYKDIKEENNPSVSEADSSLCTKEPLVEVKNEEVD